MDFVEQLFGISPDGGNGVLELSFLLGAALAATAYFWVRRRSRAVVRRR